MEESSLFHLHFLVIKLQILSKIAKDTQKNKKPSNVKKSYISFLKIEIDIKNSIKSTFSNWAETLTCVLL